MNGRNENLRGKVFQRALFVLTLAIILHPFAITTNTAQAADVPTLSSAVIRGSTIYSSPELFAAYRDYLGKPITRESVSAIITALADRYQSDGYSRPQISVDDNLVAAGVLRLDIFETRIASVRISGDPGPHRRKLEAIGTELRGDEVVRQQNLQDVLRRMRSLPGLTLSATTQSNSDAPNVYDLDLDTDFRPVSSTVRLTNRGTEEIGPNFLLGQVVANGLLGGRTSAGLLFGTAADYDEYRGLGVLASSQVGNEGIHIAFSGFRSRANPSEEVDRDDLYLRDRLTLDVSMPVFVGSSISTTLVAGLDLTDLSIARSGLRLRDERLRMLGVGLNQSWRRGAAVEYASSVEIVKGLGGLGSGLTAIDLAVDPRSADFSLLRLSLIRLARFAPNWSMRIDSFAQHTNFVLPYTERFKIGGDRLGRGFEVAEIAGDQGLGAKLEVRRDLVRAPAVIGRAALYGFYDLGATWKQDTPGRESAATAGFGLSVRNDKSSATLELARPLTHADVEGKDDLRLFFELVLRL